ncbi:hypothetical protein CTI14_68010, partial [Methylobacterium radiotolerans]
MVPAVFARAGRAGPARPRGGADASARDVVRRFGAGGFANWSVNEVIGLWFLPFSPALVAPALLGLAVG